MATISNYPFVLDTKPKIAWSDNHEKSLSKDFPFIVNGDEDPQQYVERTYLQFLWLPETLMPLKLLVPALRRVKDASSQESEEPHPLHTLLGRLLLTARSISEKYHDLPALLDKLSGEEDGKAIGEEEEMAIEEAMASYALSYEKSSGDQQARLGDVTEQQQQQRSEADSVPTWMDPKWRRTLIQRMERREFLVQILFHLLIVSLPGPRPLPKSNLNEISAPSSPSAPTSALPELSHVKRRKMKRQKKNVVPKPPAPSLNTEDHLERLMDKLSMWQLMGDLDPTGTTKRKKDELDWMQLFCRNVVEPQFKSTLPELCSLLRTKVFPNSPFSDEEQDRQQQEDSTSLMVSKHARTTVRSSSPDTTEARPLKRARTVSSTSLFSNNTSKPPKSSTSKHLSVPSSSSSANRRHPSPALSTTSTTSNSQHLHPRSRTLERSRSRSLSVTLAEEEHQKAVEAKERQRQRADSVGIGGVKKRVLTREVSMSRKPKAKPQAQASGSGLMEKTVKAVPTGNGGKKKDLVVTLVEATPEKPTRVIVGSRPQQSFQPLPFLLPSSASLSGSSSSKTTTVAASSVPANASDGGGADLGNQLLQPGQALKTKSRQANKIGAERESRSRSSSSPGPSGLSDLSELSELTEYEEEEGEGVQEDTEEGEEVWYPSTSSSPDVLLLGGKLQKSSSFGDFFDDEDDEDEGGEDAINWQAMNTPTKMRGKRRI
ncbi:hypothetical protein K435DRAFT_847070 [Dendrothele bispora CBS 962.96]|uniref:DNA replication regulator Sld3 C-terminal domain-containing protein n=1 Tax=Dendrothele bispora (strain CBS 962.96) TaxID=1314807 RepID=A0A4S8MZJ1_DENBC|nr:hypothetical protein K435DRAFT_847070 [Dendrothele bispora CBS 962.96]